MYFTISENKNYYNYYHYIIIIKVYLELKDRANHIFDTLFVIFENQSQNHTKNKIK